MDDSQFPEALQDVDVVFGQIRGGWRREWESDGKRAGGNSIAFRGCTAGIRSVRPCKSARAEAVHVRLGRKRVSRAVPAHLPG